MGSRRIRHGLSLLPEYRVWKAMKTRCLNPNATNYKDYGARGVTIFPPWRDSFPTFFQAVGARPSKEHTLERQDNNKGYEPGNVVWATQEAQNFNKRRHRLVQMDGMQLPLAMAAKVLGLTSGALKQRIKRGMDEDKALTPGNLHHRLVTLNGEQIPTAEAERRLGLKKGVLKSRLLQGMSEAEALTPQRIKPVRHQGADGRFLEKTNN